MAAGHGRAAGSRRLRGGLQDRNPVVLAGEEAAALRGRNDETPASVGQLEAVVVERGECQPSSTFTWTVDPGSASGRRLPTIFLPSTVRLRTPRLARFGLRTSIS